MSVHNGTVVWSWLHLSDIHFMHGGPAWTSDQSDVADQTIQDIKNLIARAIVPLPEAILVTGDIAFSGGIVSLNEYEEARRFVRRVRNVVGSDIPVFAVPGNHDVQRTSRSSAATHRLLSALRESREDVDTVLADDDDRERLAERFSNYGRFCLAVGAPSLDETAGLWTDSITTLGGTSIRLIGWNTALLSNDDADQQRLRLGKSSINRGVSGRTENTIVFGLTHHPTSWLDPEEGRYAAARIFRDVDVHLHGHVHTPDLAVVLRGTGQRCVVITAGAFHAEEDPAGAQTPHAYNVGAIVASADGGLHLRVWPRRWSVSQATWVADTDNLPSDQAFITHPLALDGITTSSHPLPRRTLRALAESLSSRVGRRRTAYPTDMSISELFRQDLVVPAKLTSSTRDDSPASSVPEVFAGGATPSVLVLGEPGAGKTVIAYELSRLLLQDSGSCPLFVDLTALQNDSPALSQVLASLGPSDHYEAEHAAHGLAFIVDGVDEALAAGLSRTSIASRLTALSKLAPIIVFCRRHDFEAQLAAIIADDLFDVVCHIRGWAIDEFDDFIRRLVSRQHLNDASLIDIVANNAPLMQLVRRPLRARMLTYVSETSNLPDDVTALYTAYLHRLASVTDGRVHAARCVGVPPAMTSWRGVAWRVFRSAIRKADSLPTERLFEFIPSEGVTPECASRVLAGIVEVPTSQGARFIHYSFFEFLVAQYLANALIDALPRRPGDAAQLLTRDLPLEIRRHLVRLLRSTALELNEWPSYLVSVYDQAADLSPADKLIARNLIAYIACRLEVPAERQLLTLVESEQDPFVRNSLLWALTRCNSLRALVTYLRELRTEKRLASLNRGYLLYYYGDLRDTNTPPHADDAPYPTWEHTRSTLNEKYDAESYGRVPPARKAIDMYTFCDIASVRDERLDIAEFTRFTRLLRDLRGGEIPDEALTVLEVQLTRVQPL